MKQGDYARTEKGIIGKIMYISEYNTAITTDYNTNPSISKCVGIKHIIKSSPNIIDLIEVGDYVNGHKVSDIYEDIDGQIRMKFGENGLVLAHKSNYDNYYLFEEDIKSILTHEQFESIEYKVRD